MRFFHAASFARQRTVLALALLLTSTLQGFVAQAHIHVPARAASGFAVVAADVAPAGATAPADSDEQGKRQRGDPSSTCPLCQAHSLGGAPLAQCAPASFIPVLASSIVPVDREPAIVIAAISYHWTGRGPPLE
ncbi:MAG TPA: hypothetical protein VE046_11400 [Steroidobacteraceae bacterium]|nr:hypothetical protein [Steroidobacteraceae bacterium]